jgi:hypothetical protein
MDEKGAVAVFGRRCPLTRSDRSRWDCPPPSRDGGEYRNRTCASRRTRRVSTALPYRSANSPNSNGALDWTRTSIGPFRRRLTVQLVHERMLEAPAGAAPALGGFADRRVPVSPRGRIGCAHRNRTCLNGFRVRRLTARPARDDGQREWIRTTDPLLPRQVGTTRLPCTLLMNGLPDRTRTCIPSRS